MEASFLKSFVTWTDRDSPELLQGIAAAKRSDAAFQLEIAKMFVEQKSPDGIILDPRPIMYLYGLCIWKQEKISFSPLQIILDRLMQGNISNEFEVVRFFVRAITYASEETVVESPEQVAKILFQVANAWKAHLSKKQLDQLNDRAQALSTSVPSELPKAIR